MARKFPSIDYSHHDAGRIIGIPAEDVAHLATLDLKPECGDGDKWSARQVLALAAKVHTLRAGATKAASDEIYWLLTRSSYYMLRRECGSFHRRYLRLIGEKCEPKLLTQLEAFDPMRMHDATEAGLSHVIFDMGQWINKIEGESSELKKHADTLSRRKKVEAKQTT